jgi:hypothetical protein
MANSQDIAPHRKKLRNARYPRFPPQDFVRRFLLSIHVLHRIQLILANSSCISPLLHPIGRSVGLIYAAPGLGFIFLLPPVMVTLTKRRTYWMRFLARPLGVFFFSWGSTCGVVHVPLVSLPFLSRCPYVLFPSHTFGVCDLTFPARAREPCTLPMIAVVWFWRGSVTVVANVC